MSPNFRFQLAKISLAILCFFGGITQVFSQSNKVMGEVRFEGASKVEKDSGAWIDGGYVGFLKELKGDKKVLLLPGEHQVEVRQSGYDTFVRKIVVEPGPVQVVRVAMPLSPGARAPAVTAMLKITVQPGRAAVFLDGQYVGHA